MAPQTPPGCTHSGGAPAPTAHMSLLNGYATAHMFLLYGYGRTRRVGKAGLSALAVGWPPSAVAFAFTILFHVRLRRPQTPLK
ncbi:MAG: hypothetical protein RIT02_3351 [Planctomycetota bacterium]